ncbi:MAG: adenylate kinase [Verrucomicrobiales bacterium]|nr:adenylate kinase [Verrucomicrobiales bacterium]
MRKVNVIGTSGSGKTTFSRALADKLEVPCIELDALFWKANWEMSGDEEFVAKIAQCLEGDGWVLDGNYTRTIPVKWKEVDTVIWLDYPFRVTFYRALKRAVGRSLRGTEIWPGTGNRESFRKTFFSRDSVLLWTITSYGKVRKQYREMIGDPQYESIQFVHLTSPAAARRFLAALDSR